MNSGMKTKTRALTKRLERAIGDAKHHLFVLETLEAWRAIKNGKGRRIKNITELFRTK